MFIIDDDTVIFGVRSFAAYAYAGKRDDVFIGVAFLVTCIGYPIYQRGIVENSLFSVLLFSLFVHD